MTEERYQEIRAELARLRKLHTDKMDLQEYFTSMLDNPEGERYLESLSEQERTEFHEMVMQEP